MCLISCKNHWFKSILWRINYFWNFLGWIHTLNTNYWSNILEHLYFHSTISIGNDGWFVKSSHSIIICVSISTNCAHSTLWLCVLDGIVHNQNFFSPWNASKISIIKHWVSKFKNFKNSFGKLVNKSIVLIFMD